ncbi:Uma2 family endonuclease [filamentous cyanobacterium CCT1]|uniref:Uma2 family endonuclease n=1 Tax=Nodosilinea sp. AN01ver1 TaxID=3423362 RepID=UPI000D1160A2|nr:Uma2 family endonuclease [filamentous cyanobacterium CCT1]PSN78640.1 Uma2 family endonuclease [filamentous cyanobacterium CCP4]
MTQAKVKLASFEEYLAYSDETPLEGRFELVRGELVELPPESEPNNWLANYLQFLLVAANVAPLRLIKIHALELQVPVLQPSDAANRYPDLVVLRPEHLELTQRRLTLTRNMPPPRLVVEIVSPGKTNRDRDYVSKRGQYAALGVPEYWLVDPAAQTVMVLSLAGETYQEVGVFGLQRAIASVEFPDLTLKASQIFEADR